MDQRRQSVFEMPMKRFAIRCAVLVGLLAAIVALIGHRGIRPRADFSPSEPEGYIVWQSLESQEGRYRILFPGSPVERSNKTADKNSASVSSRGWGLDQEDLHSSFFVFYFDASIAPGKVGDVLDATCMTMAEKVPGDVLTAKMLSLDNFPGREVVIDGRGTQQGIIQISRFFYVNGRHYHMGVTFRRESGGAEFAFKFLNSFELLGLR
jgi:hypothetical protein